MLQVNYSVTMINNSSHWVYQTNKNSTEIVIRFTYKSLKSEKRKQIIWRQLKGRKASMRFMMVYLKLQDF